MVVVVVVVVQCEQSCAFGTLTLTVSFALDWNMNM